MRKDILFIRVPKYEKEINLREMSKVFEKRLGKWYHIIIIYSSVDEISVELINPTFWNYIKYKFRNIFNYGK